MAISAPTIQWLSSLQDWYGSDAKASSLLAQLAVNDAACPPFSLQQGIIQYKNKIWLGSHSDLQRQVMAALHCSPIGGHSGYLATFSKISGLFFWPGMRKDILQFIRTCSVCLQAKPDRTRYPGLLEPLPIPEFTWEIISLDFIEGLPMSANANSILVVVDKYTMFAHFIPLRHPFTAASVARLFFDHVYRLHGLPKSIFSYCDRIFTSRLWQLLFQMAGIQLWMSSSYHPQTDGHTERVNQCLETFLRCFVHACPHYRVKMAD